MPLFTCDGDRKFLEGINEEMYKKYMYEVEVYKLNYQTGTENRLYHEDINRDIADSPHFMMQAHVNVEDNGLANLYKQGQQIDRQLWMYASRKIVEEAVANAGLDPLHDVPTDGDVVKVQGILWEIVTVDPWGYTVGQRYYPFEFQSVIVPWKRSGTPKSETYQEFKRN